METLHIITLALVQGITEFLPISSSAHLVLVPHLLGWPDQGMIMDIALHLGTLVAVMVYFRADVANLFVGFGQLAVGRYRATHAHLFLALVVATIPVGLVGLLIKDMIATHGRNVGLIAFTSIVFGLLLWYADYTARKCPQTLTKTTDITLPTALMWGVWQAMALIPGVSRSGICVTGGLSLGATRELAGHFGTLMALPTITLALLLSFTDINTSSLNWHTAAPTLLWGATLAFVAAMAGIHVLVSWCSRMGYLPFVVYRVVLGLGLIWFIT